MLTRLSLNPGSAQRSTSADRLPASSAGGDLSPEEVVVAYHERTKHHFHRYAAAQGFEVMVKRVAPEIVEIIDATDHAAGKLPFYPRAVSPRNKDPHDRQDNPPH